MFRRRRFRSYRPRFGGLRRRRYGMARRRSYGRRYGRRFYISGQRY